MTLQRRTVLIVEDDQELANLYRTALTGEGLRVIQVRDGAEALQYVEQRTPDLIILDIGLPRLDGKSVAQEIRSHAETGEIPIIVVTGLSGPFAQLPAERVLCKPVNVGQLIASVHRFLYRGKTSI